MTAKIYRLILEKWLIAVFSITDEAVLTRVGSIDPWLNLYERYVLCLYGILFHIMAMVDFKLRNPKKTTTPMNFTCTYMPIELKLGWKYWEGL